MLSDCPVIIEVPVAWGEMDALGHVNNAVYFRYLESGRMAYFERVGLLEQMKRTGVGPILHSVRCRFRLPLTWPDTILVGTRVSDVGEDRFTMESRVMSRQHGRVAAEAEGLIVMLDYSRQEKARIPDSIRSAIAQLESTTPGLAREE